MSKYMRCWAFMAIVLLWSMAVTSYAAASVVTKQDAKAAVKSSVQDNRRDIAQDVETDELAQEAFAGIVSGIKDLTFFQKLVQYMTCN